MIQNIINANLIDFNHVEVTYYANNVDASKLLFYLLNNDNNKILLESSYNQNGDICKFNLYSKTPIEIGKDCQIITNENDSAYLDYDSFVLTKEFEKLYFYSGDDLGAVYTKEHTVFKVYSPLSSKVRLKIEKNDNTYAILEMKRCPCGVFETTVFGDLLNKKYSYLASYNGKEVEFVDPYGKGMGLNSLYSKVVDINYVKNIGNVELQNKDTSLSHSVIYEVSIRDFTGSLVERPTYSEFIKKIPYLKELGIDYVQLLPICDFDNVDDLKNDTYNWGYDPISYFSLEGSYSSFPEDGMSRLIEFKHLVNELHKAGIRVILDVVYNHVFNYQQSIYEKSFPGYYFRKYRGKMSNGSGCGNDLATERIMVRKLIIDSVKYLLDTFDIDGYRFDLLGLIDIETSKQIIKECSSIKPNILLYGEGWDMLTPLAKENKSCIDNARMLPGMAFFNDRFRDAIKGNTFDQNSRGYASGDISKKILVENYLLGSYLSGNFIDSRQTINYIECHDNQTIFDKINSLYEDKHEANRHVMFANALTLLSLGRPLIHMGQEAAQTKHGLDNSYNIMNVNYMNWDGVIERNKMVKAVKDLIQIRKSHDIFNLYDTEEIAHTFDIYQHSSGLLEIKIKNEKYLYGNKAIVILINPTENDIHFELDDYYELYFSGEGLCKIDQKFKNVLIDSPSVKIYIKR